MSEARSDLTEWFETFWGEKLAPNGDTDLFDRYGIDGDDASEFMENFITRFEIDAANYRWYFHHGEEGTNYGGLFFAPPYRRVKRLPITPNILIEAIESKQWPLRYPVHSLPAVRWDTRVNQLLFVAPLVLLALWYGRRLVR